MFRRLELRATRERVMVMSADPVDQNCHAENLRTDGVSVQLITEEKLLFIDYSRQLQTNLEYIGPKNSDIVAESGMEPTGYARIAAPRYLPHRTLRAAFGETLFEGGEGFGGAGEGADHGQGGLADLAGVILV